MDRALGKEGRVLRSILADILDTFVAQIAVHSLAEFGLHHNGPEEAIAIAGDLLLAQAGCLEHRLVQDGLVLDRVALDVRRLRQGDGDDLKVVVVVALRAKRLRRSNTPAPSWWRAWPVAEAKIFQHRREEAVIEVGRRSRGWRWATARSLRAPPAPLVVVRVVVAEVREGVAVAVVPLVDPPVRVDVVALLVRRNEARDVAVGVDVGRVIARVIGPRGIVIGIDRARLEEPSWQ